METTTIQLRRNLWEELKKLKMHPKESFESVIERLLQNYIDDEPLTKEEIKDIEKSLKDIKSGKVYSLIQIKKELGIR